MRIRYALAATVALGLAGCEEPKITEQWEAEERSEADAAPTGQNDAAGLSEAEPAAY
jgi:hypothetical protein